MSDKQEESMWFTVIGFTVIAFIVLFCESCAEAKHRRQEAESQVHGVHWEWRDVDLQSESTIH